MPRWTAQQTAAVEHTPPPGGTLLITASAGTGKTAVLTERVLRLVADPTSGTGIDRVLVVTFTRAAAAEMRARIAAGLDALISPDPAGRHAARQRRMLGNAAIGTLHAFCRELVVGHAPELGIDPRFTLLSPGRARGESRAAAAAALDVSLLGPHRAAVEGMLRGLCGSRDEGPLVELLARFGEFLASLPEPGAWLSRAAAEDPAGPDVVRAWAGSQVGPTEGLVARVAGLAALPAMAGWPKARDWAAGVGDLLERRLAAVRAASRSGSWADLSGVAGELRLPRKPVMPKSRTKGAPVVDAEELRRLDAGMRATGDAVREWAGGLPEGGADEWRRAAERTRPWRAAWLSMAGLAAARAAARKRDLAALAFDDLERLALRLLEGPSGDAIRARRPHVFVDECQDISPLQDRILDRLAGPEARTVRVGDLKQSIYAFRLAEPSLLAGRLAGAVRVGPDEVRNPNSEVRNAAGEPSPSRAPLCKGGEEEAAEPRLVNGGIPTDPQAASEVSPTAADGVVEGGARDPGPVRRADLTGNFRSRAGVLAAVNAVMARAMRPGHGGVDYAGEAMLRPGGEEGEARSAAAGEATRPPAAGDGPVDHLGPAVEVHLCLPGSGDSEVRSPAASEATRPPALPPGEEAWHADGLESPGPSGPGWEAEVVAGRVAAMLAPGSADRVRETAAAPGADGVGPAVRPVRAGDVAILLRSAVGRAGRYVEALRARGVPVDGLSDGAGPGPALRVLLNLADAVVNPRDEPALLGVLRGPLAGVGDGVLLRVGLLRREMADDEIGRQTAEVGSAAADAATRRRAHAAGDADAAHAPLHRPSLMKGGILTDPPTPGASGRGVDVPGFADPSVAGDDVPHAPGSPGPSASVRPVGGVSLWELGTSGNVAVPAEFAAAVRRMREWRGRAEVEAPGAWLARIVEETGLAGRLGEGADGRREAAEVRRIIDRLHAAHPRGEAPGADGMGTALREAVEDAASDDAPTLHDDAVDPDGDPHGGSGAGAGAVRVLTIHRSKGLEFPVVVLAGLGDNLPGRSATEPVLWDRHAGPAFRADDRMREVAGGTLDHAMLADRVAHRGREEELRLLYVGMTRARDRLVMTARLRAGEDPLPPPVADADGAGADSDTPPESAGRMVDWVLPLLRRGEPALPAPVLHRGGAATGARGPTSEVRSAAAGEATRSLASGELGGIPTDPPTPSAGAPNPLPSGSRPTGNPDSPFATRHSPLAASADDPAVRTALVWSVRGLAARRLEPDKPSPGATEAPTVSDAAAIEVPPLFAGDGSGFAAVPHAVAGNDAGEPGGTGPQRSAGNAGPDAPMPGPAEVGSALHVLLAAVDLAGPCDVRALGELADGLTEAGMLPGRVAGRLPLRAVAEFLAGPIGRAMRAAPDAVRREVPVVFRLPVGEVRRAKDGLRSTPSAGDARAASSPPPRTPSCKGGEEEAAQSRLVRGEPGVDPPAPSAGEGVAEVRGPKSVLRSASAGEATRPPAFAAGEDGGSVDDFILVRGRVDCVVRRPDGLWVIDYKTGRRPRPVADQVATGDRADDSWGAAESDADPHPTDVGPADPSRGLYSEQVRLYARALSAAWGVPVQRRMLIELRTGEVVDVEP